jgi:hypothetical protein
LLSFSNENVNDMREMKHQTGPCQWHTPQQ